MTNRNQEELDIEEGSPIFSSAPNPIPFAQIPISVLKDGSIGGNHVRLYGDYHWFCQEKRLSNSPITFVSQKRIARDWMGGCSQQYVAKLTRELERAGWLTTIRRGLGHSNIIVLHDKKGKKLTTAQRRRFSEAVASHFRRIEEKALGNVS
jgi:hypothetical protein